MSVPLSLLPASCLLESAQQWVLAASQLLAASWKQALDRHVTAQCPWLEANCVSGARRLAVSDCPSPAPKPQKKKNQKNCTVLHVQRSTESGFFLFFFKISSFFFFLLFYKMNAKYKTAFVSRAHPVDPCYAVWLYSTKARLFFKIDGLGFDCPYPPKSCTGMHVHQSVESAFLLGWSPFIILRRSCTTPFCKAYVLCLVASDS